MAELTPATTEPTIVVSMSSGPDAVRTTAESGCCTSTTSAIRPSSEHVTQVAIPPAGPESGARSPGCSRHTWVSSHKTW